MFKNYKNLIISFIKLFLLIIYNFLFNRRYVGGYHNLDLNPLSRNFFKFLTELIFYEKIKKIKHK